MISEIDTYAGNVADLESRYRALSDDELLQICIEGGLVPEAEQVLQTEMRRRSLGSKDVKVLKDWEEKQNPKPEPQRVYLGYGVRFVGHKFLCKEDELRGIFVTTKFIVLRHASLVPLGSYRVSPAGSGLPKIVSRVPLQRDQVWQGLKWNVIAILLGLSLGVLSALTWWKHK